MDSLQLPAGAVVLGLDGSPDAARALTWAAEQAAHDRRPLVIAHALRSPAPSWLAQPGADGVARADGQARGAEELLARARDSVLARHPDLDVSVTWAAGDARHLLLEASECASLLVIGSRGGGPVERLRLGSVAMDLARNTLCPLAVVRADTATSANGVLVAVDDTERSLPTLDHAFRVAASRRAPLTVVACFWDLDSTVGGATLVDHDDEEYADTHLLVGEALADHRAKDPDVPVRVALVFGLADEILLDLARESAVVVVGSPDRSTVDGLVLGSVTCTLVERAPCTVIVVPRAVSA